RYRSAREDDACSRPTAKDGFDLERATNRPYGLSCDWKTKPKAEPAIITGSPVEAIIDPGQILGRDAGAGVYDLDHDGHRILGTPGDADRSTTGVARGVTDEVEHYMLEQVAVGAYEQVTRAIDYELDIRVHLDLANDFIEKRTKQDLRGPRLLLVRLGAREHEQRGRKPIQPARLVLDVTEVTVPFRRNLTSSGLKSLDRARDRGEWRPQL